IPLRDRLQRLVARVVYGRWQEPYEVLTDLGARLAAAADIDLLLREAVDVLCDELDLDALSVRDNLDHVLAGSSSPVHESMPLAAYGTSVGTLTYAVSRDLSGAEQRLMSDLAGQLGHMLHSRELLADLQRTREKLVLSREEERRRLRRDLHDGIGPALAGLTLKAETARAVLPVGSERASLHLDALSEEIRATVDDVRRVVEGLRPPALDELGLRGACDQAVSRLATGSGTRSTVLADRLPNLPAAVEVAAFRIVQEAATNVIRHACATSMSVSLRAGTDHIVVSVADDGVGLGAVTAGNGLTTMRERAEELGGRLVIESSGCGVSVEAKLPYTSLVPPSERMETP
ncbi:MAG: sensor histidine kinase, partial [Nocardioidaceae bacterium]